MKTATMSGCAFTLSVDGRTYTVLARSYFDADHLTKRLLGPPLDPSKCAWIRGEVAMDGTRQKENAGACAEVKALFKSNRKRPTK